MILWVGAKSREWRRLANSPQRVCRWSRSACKSGRVYSSVSIKNRQMLDQCCHGIFPKQRAGSYNYRTRGLVPSKCYRVALEVSFDTHLPELALTR